MNASSKDGNLHDSLHVIQQFGDVLKVKCTKADLWEVDQQIVLHDEENNNFSAFLVRKFDTYLYLYTKLRGPSLTERRKLPRMVMSTSSTIHLGDHEMNTNTVDINWEGFTLAITEESSRLKLKLFKGKPELTVTLGDCTLRMPVKFIHGKSSQIKVGVLISDIDQAMFEKLCNYLITMN